MTDWLNVPNDPSDYFGFVYKITNNKTGKVYFGSKQFHNRKRIAVKGKKNKRTVLTESNWRSYLSSSNSLQAEIQQQGEQNYTFEIVSLHQTKSDLKFAEALCQWKAKLNGIDLYNIRIEPLYFSPSVTKHLVFC